MTTTIEYCYGIHRATRLPMSEYRDIITESENGESEEYMAAVHKLEVTRAEKQSDLNRAGLKGCELVEQWIADWVDNHSMDDDDDFNVAADALAAWRPAAQEVE